MNPPEPMQPEEIVSDEPERVLACPVCGRALQIETKHGVTIDVCPDHGVWLDAGELEAVVSALGRRMRRGKRRAVKSARHSGRVDGALFGWWSLLGD